MHRLTRALIAPVVGLGALVSLAAAAPAHAAVPPPYAQSRFEHRQAGVHQADYWYHHHRYSHRHWHHNHWDYY
jgi:hypothetical protein